MKKRRHRPRCFRNGFGKGACGGALNRRHTRLYLCHSCEMFALDFAIQNPGCSLMNRDARHSEPQEKFRCWTNVVGERDCAGGFAACHGCVLKVDCDHPGRGRQRGGPTGRRKNWSLLVDSCLRCGNIRPVHKGGMTREQISWVRRWNRRCEEDYART